jgi:hypothetical protein
VTPWLILLIHAPWYSTYDSHFKDNECMREHYEALVTQHAVDIMVSICSVCIAPKGAGGRPRLYVISHTRKTAAPDTCAHCCHVLAVIPLK